MRCSKTIRLRNGFLESFCLVGRPRETGQPIVSQHGPTRSPTAAPQCPRINPPCLHKPAGTVRHGKKTEQYLAAAHPIAFPAPGVGGAHASRAGGRAAGRRRLLEPGPVRVRPGRHRPVMHGPRDPPPPAPARPRRLGRALPPQQARGGRLRRRSRAGN